MNWAASFRQRTPQVPTDLSPVEDEYFSVEQLVDCGRRLSSSGTVGKPRRGHQFFTRQLDDDLELISNAYRANLAANAAGDIVPPAAEWLLDNYLMIAESVAQVRRDLPPRFYGQLPIVRRANHVEEPRVMQIARHCVRHSLFEITQPRLSAIVNGFQETSPLEIGELWATPAVLRFVLIDELARIAQGIENARAMLDHADAMADQLVRARLPGEGQKIRAEYDAYADDDAFVGQLLYRLSGEGVEIRDTIAWLEQHLDARGSDTEEALIVEQNRQTAANVRIGNVILSLRTLNDIDWSEWLVSVSVVDAQLRERSDFAALDSQSQSQYRRVVEDLSRWSGKDESDVAKMALDLLDQAPGDAIVSDVGSFLIGPDRVRLETALSAKVPWRLRLRRRVGSLGWVAIAFPVALFTLALVTAAFGALERGPAGIAGAAFLTLLALLPASEAATGLFNTLVTMFTEPTRLVGYEYEDGIPARARTMVVVPCLIGSRDAIDDLVRTLEVHHLSNPKGEITFALLSDWPDSAHERNEEDDALLDYARHRVDELSRRYLNDGQSRFFLLHRVRLFNPGQGVWMGWERKRGKLMELDSLLRGDTDTTFLPSDTALPVDVKYIMTLDADTRMTRDAVTRLVGKMEHPLNQPRIDAETGRVHRGYGVMQPRVTASLTTGKEASAFQRIFSSNRGFDPYVFTVSDVYQDLVGEGSFTGKGLYHIDTFREMAAEGIRENTVLSHDLLEGGLVRCALITDVELVEDFPIRYETEVARQHRWARGDWQLLPYLRGTQLPLSALQRWKMFDNLRRSLVPVAWLGASILGWIVLDLKEAMFWQALLVLSLFVSPTLGLLRDMAALPKGTGWLAHLLWLADQFASNTAQVVLRIILIAHTATVMIDAIFRTFYRLFLSRRNLLEWQAASAAPRIVRTSAFAYWSSMRWSVAISLTAVAATLALGGAWPVAAAFGILWTAAPFIAWSVSRSAETEDQLIVSAADRTALRQIARRTWSYFEVFVTEEHNWLPPDNFQEIPTPTVAARTSPTNIGLYLLSVVAARDFGWIALSATVTRLERTIAAMAGLDTHNGHFFNWYDTRRAAPLDPRYVSTVDSGNLAGHLIAVSAACSEWAEAHVAHLSGGFDGLRDCLGVLAEEIETIPDDRRTLRPLRHHLTERIADFHRALRTMDEQPEMASVRVIGLSVIAADIEKLTRDYDAEIGTKVSRSAIVWAQALGRACEARIADTTMSRDARDELRNRLEVVAQKTREMAFKMDFGFLLHRDRLLLSIGYRVDDDTLDESAYDLLASEARLASFFAIAKGDLPTEHWFRLGRPIVPVGARGSLMSWSGSMFEYLMPTLVMQEQQGGILNQSNRLSVRRQIHHGRRRGFPWGVSESAFNARDPEMTYQYMTFGVPSLGIKRGLASQAVVAPYATILASQFQPAAAVDNLARLRKMGAMGQYGFYDAVDFTPARVPENETYVMVRNFMAHHHGMSIAAISNVVHEGRLRERFHSDAVIEAAELLLQERAPRAVPHKIARIEAEPVRGRSDLSARENTIIDNPAAHPNAAALLSNGHYSLLLSSRGSGRASWNGQAVTRWRPDPVEPGAGPYLFLRDTGTDQWWSATAEPVRVADEHTQTVISDSKVEYHKQVGTLRSRIDVIVASDRDAEGRCLTLTNTGSRDRLIEVTSYSEPVIGPADADFAHPVFSRMFVHTEISRNRQVIHARRNPRRPDEPAMRVAHMLVDFGAGVGAAEAETDRRRFIGRGRTLADAAAFDPGATFEGSDGFTLDPIFALRRTLLVPAGGKAQLIFWTIAAPAREDIDAAVNYFSHAENFVYEAMQAWTRSQIQLRHANSDLTEAALFKRLASYLIWPDPTLKIAGESDLSAPQSALWPMGISGDHPIMVLRIDSADDIAVVRKAIRAHIYYHSRGLITDLVIINERAASYIQDLQSTIEGTAEITRARSQVPASRDHIFTLRRDTLADVSYDALLAAARVVLHARNGTFSAQIDRAETLVDLHFGATLTAGSPPAPRRMPLPAIRTKPDQPKDLQFWNGYGGFSKDGRDYVVRLGTGEATPQPWINVISNGDFGFHISAEGAGFTWSRNSRDHHLTPWSNDPVTNRPGETIHLTDLDTNEVFTPFAALSSSPGARFEATHGAGISRFICIDGSLRLTATQIVDPVDPVKITRLSVTNSGAKARRLRLYCYGEWVMGNNRDKTAPMLRTQESDGILMVENPFSIQFPGRTAFLASDAPLSSFTVSRGAFLGMGSTLLPDAVARGAGLSGDAAVIGDPCAALAIDLTLAPGATRTVTLLLGDAAGRDAAIALAQKHRKGTFEGARDATARQWDDFLNVLQIKTPDPAFDIMVNRWLPYQTLSCRIQARSAFYQASGAFGFRDQLQDTLSLLLHDPALARAQILNAAGRQFPEGDVQHWWLPETGAGVRTMISDDVVWLTYGITQYIDCTGDAAILDEVLPFLTGPQLEPGEHDSFFQPKTSDETASVYDHAARALDLAIARTGERGLSLILGGDWNDGMNRVGEEGRGESIWLSWFLAHALDVFAPVAEARGDTERAAQWREHLGNLKSAIESAGWDGDHYRRGYYDNGTPLGSLESDECKIDSIAQSWSVMSGQGDPERQNGAMDQVLHHLVDDEARIVRLFTPPFSDTVQEPGYIKGYPPGVRENGGQYTHAATWTVYALAMLGRGDDAKACFDMLNPINHALTRAAADRYRVEPYVAAADVYGADDKAGRGGWTWYTGSGGWLYRAAVEAILGIRRRGDRLFVTPALPTDWPGFEATVTLDGKSFRIVVTGAEITINGEVIDPQKGVAI
ncbi:GH36-type glycosyl hydrolase domain-containing protein [Oceaniovalibus sp. ACAM 378]|uniref:GH36-type glycosyl hydrolase domain-containing protein n=1 Tax=Oceaniovalibus sp. ACAM 378 TaxID=2599923 RepID=UPI0011D42FF0|nr:glucoamylase family protein [Oceaniovalibus sp. ACAM 378]TYB87934.1 protein ndvB [Oceaniovalibus sp. ACAM 378]